MRQNNKSPNDRKRKKDWNRGVLKITGVAQQPIHEEPHRPHKNHHGQDADPEERQVFTRMQSPAVFSVLFSLPVIRFGKVSRTAAEVPAQVGSPKYSINSRVETGGMSSGG